MINSSAPIDAKIKKEEVEETAGQVFIESRKRKNREREERTAASIKKNRVLISNTEVNKEVPSLSGLPDLLKAEICSFLNFKEISKLNQVNKKTQAFLKRYKLDKPNIFGLTLWTKIENVNPYVECSVKVEQDSKEIELPNIDYREDKDIHTPKILELINKFHSIEVLTLVYHNFYEGDEWQSIETKIENVSFENGRFIVSRDALLKFFKCFKRMDVYSSQIDWSYIDDEMFLAVTKNGTSLGLALGMNVQPTEVNVTDAKLDIISKIQIPIFIRMEELTTQFTFGRIKKLIEAAVSGGMVKIDWDFGILKKEPYNDVQRFVKDEFQEMVNRFNAPIYLQNSVSNQSENSHIICHREDLDYFIGFSVKIPEELIQRGNENEREHVVEGEAGEEDALDD